MSPGVLPRHGQLATRFLFAVAVAAPVMAGAQEFAFKPVVQWQIRADAAVAPAPAIQLGAGVNVPLGYYVRLDGTLAAGPEWTGGRTITNARLDLTARYLFDPFHEIPWAPYVAGGLTSIRDEKDAPRLRGYLLLILGIEGPAYRGWRTAFEGALGGGVRIGVVLRRARENGR